MQPNASAAAGLAMQPAPVQMQSPCSGVARIDLHSVGVSMLQPLDRGYRGCAANYWVPERHSSRDDMQRVQPALHAGLPAPAVAFVDLWTTAVC